MAKSVLRRSRLHYFFSENLINRIGVIIFRVIESSRKKHSSDFTLFATYSSAEKIFFSASSTALFGAIGGSRSIESCAVSIVLNTSIETWCVGGLRQLLREMTHPIESSPMRSYKVRTCNDITIY